jgi:hypothetical protein
VHEEPTHDTYLCSTHLHPYIVTMYRVSAYTREGNTRCKILWWDCRVQAGGVTSGHDPPKRCTSIGTRGCSWPVLAPRCQWGPPAQSCIHMNMHTAAQQWWALYSKPPLAVTRFNTARSHRRQQNHSAWALDLQRCSSQLGRVGKTPPLEGT